MSTYAEPATSPVCYICIGTRLTVLVHTHDSTSSTYQLQTPFLIALAKRHLYRHASSAGNREYNLQVTLDNFLRNLWDSYYLQFFSHIVFLFDMTDTQEFKYHTLRWFHALISPGSAVSSLSYPCFVCSMADVARREENEEGNNFNGEHAVVIDLGYSWTRLVPILHGIPVQEMVFCTLGMGSLSQGMRGTGPASNFRTTLHPKHQMFLEDYVDLVLYVEEQIKKRGEEALKEDLFVAEVDARSNEIREGKSLEELSAIESFIDGLEDIVIRTKQSALRKGIGVVLSTWVVTGGGAHVPAVNCYLGYLLGKHLPESMLVWV